MKYIDSEGAVNVEALRASALESLTLLHTEVVFLQTSESYHAFWTELHNIIGLEKDSNKKNSLRKVEAQLIGVSAFIWGFIETALSSPERFELYVKIKANELGGDDEKHNYFWALQIRRDQVVAMMTVIAEVVALLKKWVDLKPLEVIESFDFLRLGDQSIEDRVYSEAELEYKRRS